MQGKLLPNRSRWIPEEIALLEKLLDKGATQLEIAAALPHRSWDKIRKRIRMLRGTGIDIPESGYLDAQDTYQSYLARNPSAAIAMELSILTNSSPHSRC
jgi:hypothetical protein